MLKILWEYLLTWLYYNIFGKYFWHTFPCCLTNTFYKIDTNYLSSLSNQNKPYQHMITSGDVISKGHFQVQAGHCWLLIRNYITHHQQHGRTRRNEANLTLLWMIKPRHKFGKILLHMLDCSVVFLRCRKLGLKPKHCRRRHTFVLFTLFLENFKFYTDYWVGDNDV